jgi:hypothetical protein
VLNKAQCYKDALGERWHHSMHSYHKLTEVVDQFHVPDALLPGKNPQYPLHTVGSKASWDAVKSKFLASAGNRLFSAESTCYAD